MVLALSSAATLFKSVSGTPSATSFARDDKPVQARFNQVLGVHLTVLTMLGVFFKAEDLR